MAAVPPSAALAAVSAPQLAAVAARAAAAAAAASGAAPPPAAAAAAGAPPPQPADIAVGIDLGTKNSVVGAAAGDRVTIIPVDGHRTTPSVVSFLPSGERLVGRPAVARLVQDPTRTVYDAKRLIGRDFSDAGVTADAKHMPYSVVADARGRAAVRLPSGTIVRPEEVSAAVLARLRAAAEQHLKRPVNRAVITVPAYFNDAQRMSTKAAGEMAGLKVLRVINEPTAAAIAYGIDTAGKPQAEGSAGRSSRNVLVFDLGGGTFDCSLLSCDQGLFEVLATSGDTRLGGQDVDNALLGHLVKQFRRKHGVDVSSNRQAMERLRLACVQAKHALSQQQKVEVPLAAAPGAAQRAVAITRTALEQLAKPVLRRLRPPVDRVLSDARLPRRKVDDVLLVGGATRMPAVRRLVENYFGADRLRGRDVNPDEAVAVGAALQAAKLSGAGGEAAKRMLLLDVAPLTTGIETAGGFVTPVIERNTPVPARQTKAFTTTGDGQSAVDIRVLQGERPRARDNALLGEFTLGGIPPAPRGIPRVEVTFDIDADGILNVKAVDKGSKSSKQITIASRRALSSADVQRMVADARRNEAQDRRLREAREAAEQLRALAARGRAAALALPDSQQRERRGALEAAEAAERWLDARLAGGGEAPALRELQQRAKQLQGAVGSALYSAGSAG
eukprot:TRINITY_DN9445_c0_g1_i1.p1 TRINITY_DN9445_c0_g1~~TRINITY_DN9445_c0_g1_i1.p1  ORF type:complete len:696 (+),score=228.24 TRINITY_DN9445_c0_g1_i1:68-2089(+)